MNLLRLAWKSLLNRRSTALLTILTIAVSVALMLGVEKVRLHARQSFANTVSGTDLIVGARRGRGPAVRNAGRRRTAPAGDPRHR